MGDIYYEYFGMRYEIFGENLAILISATNAKGRFIVPKFIMYNGIECEVCMIGSYKRAYMLIQPDDKRIKDKSRFPKEAIGYYGPFTENHEYETDFEKALPPNTTVTYVKLPETISVLYPGAFRRCHALEEIELSKKIEEIPERCFSGCISLKFIQLHEGIKKIGDHSFIGCSAMKEITIPSTVTAIGRAAFADSATSKCGLEVVNILNDEGTVLMYPDSFTERVKIKYLGKKSAKKTAKAVTEKPEKKNSIDLEKLIQAALIDGVVTDKERAILIKKVKEAGGDTDEFEMLLNARIFEAQKKAAPAQKQAGKKESPAPKAKPAPKAEAKPVVKTAPSAGGKGSMTINITAATTVADLCEQFKATFGGTLRIYQGNKRPAGKDKVSTVAAKTGTFKCGGSMTVKAFVKAMFDTFGLKVKVASCDDWVVALDALTLEQVGKIKKNATKGDMEKMI